MTDGKVIGASTEAAGLGRSELRLVAAAVPNMQDVHSLRPLRNIVENAVRAKDNLAERPPRSPRVGWPNKGESGQNLDVIKDPIADPQGSIRIIPRDVRTDVTQIFDRLVGPDYFEVHALAQDLSSS